MLSIVFRFNELCFRNTPAKKKKNRHFQYRRTSHLIFHQRRNHRKLQRHDRSFPPQIIHIIAIYFPLFSSMKSMSIPQKKKKLAPQYCEIRENIVM